MAMLSLAAFDDRRSFVRAGRTPRQFRVRSVDLKNGWRWNGARLWLKCWSRLGDGGRSGFRRFTFLQRPFVRAFWAFVGVRGKLLDQFGLGDSGRAILHPRETHWWNADRLLLDFKTSLFDFAVIQFQFACFFATWTLCTFNAIVVAATATALFEGEDSLSRATIVTTFVGTATIGHLGGRLVHADVGRKHGGKHHRQRSDHFDSNFHFITLLEISGLNAGVRIRVVRRRDIKSRPSIERRRSGSHLVRQHQLRW